jgi:hypothetical protein
MKVGSAWNRMRPVVVPALVLLAVILIMFWRLWTPIDGERRALAWDAQWEYWGDLQYQVDALGDGELPLWNPYDRLGYPFHADPQAQLLYPVQWLMWLVAAIAGPAWWLIAVKAILHFWIVALGMYVWLERRKLPAPACYLGALVVITSYAMLHNAMSALNWSFAWTPWIVLAVEAWAARPAPWRGALVALAVGLAFLGGAPAAIWYAVLVGLPWTVLALALHGREARRAGEGRRYLRAVLVSGGVALGLLLMLTAAQLSATAGMVSDTVRDNRGLGFFGTTVFDAVDVVSFFLPRAIGSNVYLGWGPILWIGCLLLLRPSPRVALALALCTLAIVCSLGERGPVLAALASVIEPFELFRRAHRYLYVLAVPVGFLAAEGLAALAAADDAQARRARRFVLATTALAVLICAVGYAVKVEAPWKPDQARDAFAWGLGAAIAAGVTTWLVLEHRGRFLWIAVAVAFLDLWICRFEKIEDNMHAIPTPRRDGKVEAMAGVPLELRVYDRTWLRYRPGIRLGVRDFAGYEDDPLALSRYARLRDAARAAPRHLAHAGVGYLLEDRDADTGGSPLPRTAADRPALTAAPDLGPGAWRVAGPAPTVAWYDAAVLTSGAAEAQRELLAAPAGSRAVLERPTLSAAERERAVRVDGAVPTVPGRLVALGRNRLRATVEAPADGVVVILEGYYRRGWSATVDGKAAPIVPANAAFRGVLVGPGAHVIEMEYRAPGYLALAALVPLGFLAIGGLVVIGRRREREAA